MPRRLLVAVSLAFLASAASAQTIVIEKQRPTPLGPRSETTRVNVSVNFFVPGRIDGSEESVKLQESVRRLLYELAGRECGVLRDTLAAECQLDSVNVNVSRHHGQPTSEGVSFNGSMTFRISLK